MDFTTMPAESGVVGEECTKMRGRLLRCAQMTVLMLMLAGSDTSKQSHKVLIGVLPKLPSPVIDRVRCCANGVSVLLID